MAQLLRRVGSKVKRLAQKGGLGKVEQTINITLSRVKGSTVYGVEPRAGLVSMRARHHHIKQERHRLEKPLPLEQLSV